IISRSKSVFLNDRLQSHGLTAGQFPVLMLLSHRQNIIQEELVRHYRLDKGTIARAVKKLEEAGYIRRITDPGNRRAVRLFLTKKGEKIIPGLRAINQEWEAGICSGLTRTEIHTLNSLMRHVAARSFSLLRENGDACHE
ncbi:MAG: MarR family transcriptional regulator, partial [Methanomicrobiales archaeon]|nr:MarR family transcriptional regulator [Methanomicrobiales archaeon]